MNANGMTENIIAEMRDFADHRDFDSDGNMSTTHLRVFADRIEAAAKRERGNAERERHLLKSCARWIFTHDIYGHMSSELLAECKELLHDDGQFLFPIPK